MNTLRKNLLFITALLGMLSSCETPKKETKTVKLPQNIISVKKGILMKETYKRNTQAIIERNKENGNYQATEYAWIDLDSLKNYIALLDKVAELNNTKVTGVRIYFSQYPEDEKNYRYSKEEKNKLLPGRETLFFAPTMKSNSNPLANKYPILENVPFYIQHTNENPLVGEFKVIDRLNNPNRATINMTKFTSTTNSVEDESNETSLLLNELAMFPPPKTN